MSDRNKADVIPPHTLADRESMPVPLGRAEIDHQIATAHAFPRSHEKAIKAILGLATLDEDTAKSCIYALPRGNKPIKGPSARFAEIVFSQWGNCRVSSAVVDVDKINKVVMAEGIFHDLETNAARRVVVQRRIVDSKGALYNDDMITVTGNAAASIAARNAILVGVPRAVWGRAYERCEKVLAGGIKTLSTAREETMKEFAAFGVTPERVYHALEIRGMADITIDHVILLRGMHATLVNGEATVEEMFPLPTAKMPAGKAPAPPPPPGGAKVAGKESDTKADTAVTDGAAKPAKTAEPAPGTKADKEPDTTPDKAGSAASPQPPKPPAPPKPPGQ